MPAEALPPGDRRRSPELQHRLKYRRAEPDENPPPAKGRRAQLRLTSEGPEAAGGCPRRAGKAEARPEAAGARAAGLARWPPAGDLVPWGALSAEVPAPACWPEVPGASVLSRRL